MLASTETNMPTVNNPFVTKSIIKAPQPPTLQSAANLKPLTKNKREESLSPNRNEVLSEMDPNYNTKYDRYDDAMMAAAIGADTAAFMKGKPPNNEAPKLSSSNKALPQTRANNSTPNLVG